MIEKNTVTGIILSGGKSSRMGSDKGLMLFNGKPLLEYAIEALEPNCGNIILSTNKPDNYLGFKIQMLRDEVSEIGPMGGIFSCLKKSGTEINIVLSCDTPYIDSSLISFLIENIDTKYEALIPMHSKNKVEPLCAYYNSGILGAMEKFIVKRNYKMMNFLDSINAKRLNMKLWKDFKTELFANINRPSDLR